MTSEFKKRKQREQNTTIQKYSTVVCKTFSSSNVRDGSKAVLIRKHTLCTTKRKTFIIHRHGTTHLYCNVTTYYYYYSTYLPEKTS